MKKSWYIGIFFTTMSLLMLEISLTRIFSVTMWYHFAFLAVSLAVFGMGTGGLAVYLFPTRVNIKDLQYYSFLCGISFVAVLILSMYVSLPLDMSYTWLPVLLLTYITCSLPFFFGGMTLSLLLLHESKKVSSLYFSDLVGSGTGCFIVISVLNTAGGPPSLLVIALCALTGTFFFGYHKKKFVGGVLLVAVLFGGALLYNGYNEVLDIKMAKGFSQHHITTSEWNCMSRVAVFELGAPFYGWALSETWTGDVVNNLGMDIDANAFSPIVNYKDPRKESLLYDVTAVPFHIKTGNVLIIGSGGGRDVVTAQLFPNTVTAVEINPLIVDLVTTVYGDYSGHLYNQVPVHVQEGRNYLEHSQNTYDIIQMALVDTWAASASGAYALSETYLYTVEAFLEYREHLDKDGILSISRWIFDTPQQTLRLVSLGKEALKREGIDDASSYMVIVKNKRVATFLMKKTPFTRKEIEKIAAICDEMHFEILYSVYHQNDPVFTELITTDDPDTFFAQYPLNVEPSTDDHPFFFYTVKGSDLPQLISLDLESESLKNNVALLWLFRLIIISCVLVFFFLLIPPVFFAKKSLDRKVMGYFALIGLGFMFVEIPLMQKFMLILGHPVYALSVILFSLLCSGGIGSYLTNNLSKKGVAVFMVYLIVLVFVYTAGFSALTETFLGSSFTVRVVASVLLTSALGVAMGMPFPAGIKIADSVSHAAIPWAWSINGATSVLGSALSVFVGINVGFSAALIAGAVFYGLALVFFSFYIRN